MKRPSTHPTPRHVAHLAHLAHLARLAHLTHLAHVAPVAHVARLDPAAHAAAVSRVAFALCAVLAGPVHALGCDELRAQVEAKVRAGGVKDFNVVVAEAAASAPGRVVGTCDLGRRKLLYTTRPAVPATAPAPAPAAASAARPADRRPSRAPVITECRDGSVITSGECPK